MSGSFWFKPPPRLNTRPISFSVATQVAHKIFRRARRFTRARQILYGLSSGGLRSRFEVVARRSRGQFYANPFCGQFQVTRRRGRVFPNEQVRSADALPADILELALDAAGN